MGLLVAGVREWFAGRRIMGGRAGMWISRGRVVWIEGWLNCNISNSITNTPQSRPKNWV